MNIFFPLLTIKNEIYRRPSLNLAVWYCAQSVKDYETPTVWNKNVNLCLNLKDDKLQDPVKFREI